MRKQLFAFVLALTLLVLAGCAAGQGSAETTAPQAQTEAALPGTAGEEVPT